MFTNLDVPVYEDLAHHAHHVAQEQARSPELC